jgi:hypothetical protein
MKSINRRELVAGALVLLGEARLPLVFGSQRTEDKNSNPVKTGSIQNFGATDPAHAGETLLDLWDQAPRIALVHEVSADPSAKVPSRQRPNYLNPNVTLRFDRVYVGAFSIELMKAEVPSKVRCHLW